MRQGVRDILAGAASCAAACLIASSAVRTQTPEASPLRVVTTSPEGETDAMVTQASIRFSEAMVPLGGGAAVDRVAFVTIEPTVDVSYRWSTSHILVVTPRAGRFPHASTVTVTIGAEATAVSGRRLGAPHSFSFTTTPPRLIGVQREVPSDPARPRLLHVRFDQPVRAADLLEHVTVRTNPQAETVPELSAEARAHFARVDPDGLRQRDTWARERRMGTASQPVTVRVNSSSGDAASVALAFDDPAMALRPLVVSHTGAASPEGPLRRTTPETLTVATPPRLSVSGPDCDGPCSPDHAALTIVGAARDLATAIALTDITDPAAERRVVREPSARPWFEFGLFSFASLGYALHPGHRYAVRVDGSLTSIDGGDVLGAPWLSVFSVGGRPSLLALATTQPGHVVWEAAAGPRIPVLTRNLIEIGARARAVPRAEFGGGLSTAFGVPDSEMRTTAVNPPPDGAIRETFVDLTSALSPKGVGVVRLRVAPGAAVPGTATEPRRWFPGPRQFVTEAVVQVTNLGLTVRGNTQGLALFASRLDTGAAIPGAAIALLDHRNVTLWRGRTRADGIALVTLDRPKASPAIAVVEHEGDASFVAIEDPGSRAGTPAGVLFTDRGVYRPGESVHVKALLRIVRPGGIQTPRAGSPVTLTLLRDGDAVRQFTSTLGRSGGADWVVPIPADGPTDQDYQVAMRRGRPDASLDRYDPSAAELVAPLTIKAIRPVEFEMSLTSAVELADGPPAIASTVTARDLSNVALSAAAVDWSVSRMELSLPAALQREQDEGSGLEFESSDPGVEDAYDAAPFERRGGGHLDADGRLETTLALPAGLAGRGVFRVSARVRDASSQVQGSEQAVEVWPEGYVGLADQDDLPAGTRALRLVAWTPAGTAIAGIPLEITFSRADQASAPSTPVRVQTRTGEGPVRVDVPAAFAGVNVRVEARPSDAQRAIMPGRMTVVAGRAVDATPTPTPTPPEHERVASTLTMTLDRDRYQPGDRGRLRLVSNESRATAFVTIERGAVLSAHAVTLEAGAGVVEFPIGDSPLDGMHARVSLVLGRRSPCCARGDDDPDRPQTWWWSVPVPIDRAAATLAVTIDAPTASPPGSRVPVRVRVRDRDGKPADADVTVWAVDEGVLALTRYAMPDPIARVYQPAWSWLSGADTRDFLLGRVMPLDPRMLVQTSMASRDSAAAPPPVADDAAVRRDLRPLAFWAAAVATGADGVAEIQATLPDTLTRYRVMAVAADARSRFGRAEAPLLVAKPVMARPAPPRFLTRGDRATLRTTVAAAAVQGTGSVRVESLTPALLRVDGGSQPITLVTGARATTAVGLEAVGAGAARIRVTATVGDAVDVIERDVPILDGTLKETSAASGEASPTATETIVLPAGIDRAAGGLSIDVRSTMLVGLAGAGEYVRDYPYLCAEQAASRALVLVLAAALPQTLELPGAPASPAARRGAAQKALAALDAYRCDDGAAFGYWPADCRLRSPYLTAYVLLVLETAAGHGFTVPGDLRARAAAGLETALAIPPSPADRAWRAFAVKVLADAGRRPVAALDAAMADLDGVPVFALAHLYDAAHTIDAADPRAADLRRRVRNALTPGVSAHVEEPAGACEWCWASNGKSTAIVLDALARGGALDAAEARAMTTWLLGARRKGTWRSTQENAWALMALATYQRVFEPKTGSGAATVTLGARPLLTHRFDAARPAAERMVPVAEVASALPSGSGRLTFAADGGSLFYATRLTLRLPASSAPPLEHGITVTREYRPVVQGRDGVPAMRFAAGDLVRVVVTVRLTESRSFVALTDPLPAGFEVVDTSLATTATDGAVDAAARRSFWSSGFDRTERYDHRVDVFGTWLERGTHETSYLARATTPGTFFASPTTAEAMYEPEVAGRGASATIVID